MAARLAAFAVAAFVAASAAPPSVAAAPVAAYTVRGTASAALGHGPALGAEVAWDGATTFVVALFDPVAGTLLHRNAVEGHHADTLFEDVPCHQYTLFLDESDLAPDAVLRMFGRQDEGLCEGLPFLIHINGTYLGFFLSLDR